MIEIHNLHKSFGENKVLNGIDLTVEAGNVVVVLGPRGSGKSTLLRCINLLEVPQRGTLKLGDIQVSFSDLQKKDILDIRRNSAMVFQGCNLFSHKTALQNVTEGLIVVRQVNKKETIDLQGIISTR